MKSLITLTFLASTLSAGTALAVPRTDVPKTKLTLTEAQITAIKNERGRPGNTKANTHDLENLLQDRLREASHLIHFRDHTSLDKTLTFSGLALQAWNPELRNMDAKTMIVENIVKFGFVDGFIVPTMAMMDLAYASGNEGFGNLMNVMLADITPNIAEAFKKQYSIPTLVNDNNFHQITAQGRNGMWTVLMSQIDPEFYEEHYKVTADSSSRFNPPPNDDSIFNFGNNALSESYVYGVLAGKEYDPKEREAKVNDFINVNLKGDRTAIKNYLKKIGRNDNSENIKAKRKLFSSALGSESTSCLSKCLKEIGKTALDYAGDASLFSKSWWMIGSAATAGAAIGADTCRTSSECGGSKEQKQAEKAQKESAAKEKEAQDQKYKETMDDYRKQEAAKQLEADKKDPEKMKQLQKMKEDYEKYKKESQKTNDDTESDEENTEVEDAHNRNGRDIKPMLNDEESSGTSIEDIQKMKKQQGIPMIPDEIGSSKIFTEDQHSWVTTVMEKETHAVRKEVSVIYPTNPNLGN